MKKIPKLAVTKKDREIAEYIAENWCYASVSCIGANGRFKGEICPFFKDHIAEHYDCGGGLFAEIALQFLKEQFPNKEKIK